METSSVCDMSQYLWNGGISKLLVMEPSNYDSEMSQYLLNGSSVKLLVLGTVVVSPAS